MTTQQINWSDYAEEVERGLSAEQPELDDALERQAFYDYQGARYERLFKRDAESSFDFQGRPHRPSGFLRECIEILCEHVYCPGPSRKWSAAAGNEFLGRVWSDNHLDALLQEADELATLNDCAAIQIDAGGGDFTAKPLTYRLWGREQFHVWTDPNDDCCPLVVCTKDKYNLRTRYRLWDANQVQTFLTKQPTETMSEGRVAYPEGPPEPHEYGCLPFSFISYKKPVRSFWVSSIGELLHKAEVRIDDRLSRLDESINKHLNPIPIAEGMPADWKPILEPQRFIRTPKAGPIIGPTGGYEPGDAARLYYLQVSIDSVAAWDDLLKYMNQCLEAARVPMSAVRMEQTGVASGIALVVEQAPLLTRARKRRGMYSVYEQDLACRSLRCAGNHYGMPALVAAADKGKLVTGWPQPSIPIPTPDRLELLQGEIRGGFKSFIMGVQEWYGVCRDEAVEMIGQVETDNAELASLAPSLVEIAQNEPALPGQQITDPNQPAGATS